MAYSFFSAASAQHDKAKVTGSKNADSVKPQSNYTKRKQTHKTFIKKPPAQGKKKPALNSTFSTGLIQFISVLSFFYRFI